MNSIEQAASIIRQRIQSKRTELNLTDPAVLQMLIGLLEALLGILPACFGGAAGPLTEVLAYRYITNRPIFLNRTARIKAAIRKTWYVKGGRTDIAMGVVDEVDNYAYKIDRPSFHSAWLQVHGER